MTVWCHLPTIFKQRRVLQIVGLLTLCVALITTLFFSVTARAEVGTNQTISFQGRLLDTQGNPVPDGYYNIQFNIYQDGDGKTAGDTTGSPAGSLKWSETYINNGGNNGVFVKSGYLSVDLGSKTPFGTSVDWNQDTLWLSMNVAGSSTICTTFGASPCLADGEMLPMKRLTATPYALNSAKLGGISADGFIQNSITQQAGNFNIAGTGTANILQGSTSVLSSLFDRADAGSLSIGSTNATSISIGSATADQSVSIGTGSGNSTVAIGSSSGTSQTSLNSGSGGVSIASNGGDVTISSSSGAVALSTSGTDQLTIDNAGIIATDQNSHLVVNGSATFNKALNVQSVVSSATGQTLALSSDTGTSISVGGATSASFTGQSVQIGDGTATGEPTLLTLDKSTAAPLATGDAFLGSMYYDTTIGKLQCYEADGWGNCSASPDTFVSLSPEYSNAVTNGTGIGTLSTDLCSDTLNINDGTSSQPTICGTNETYNFYNWTSGETTDQTKSIYVTYQLPTNFKQFVADSTSLMGRTDSSNATVSYQLYRNTSTGLVACGTEISVSTGAQTSWQKGSASGSDDPASCTFSPGDSVVVKVNLTAKSNAHAYISTLNFAFSATR